MRLPRRAATSGALYALAAAIAGPPLPLAAVELSDEQQLIVDSWAVVQRAFRAAVHETGLVHLARTRSTNAVGGTDAECL